MSDEPTPENPRVALIESNLARAREKLAAAETRVDQLREQVAGLETALDFERAAAESPAEPPAEE